MDGPDTRYGTRAWDRRPPMEAWDQRPGDGVDPSALLGPEEVVYAVAAQAPMPAPAPLQPRYRGYENPVPTIVDVLNIPPSSGLLMNDTPTRQDSGQPGTLRPGETGSW